MTFPKKIRQKTEESRPSLNQHDFIITEN